MLCTRLTDSLGSDSHSVELAVELDGAGSCFDVVTNLFDARDKDFVEHSQDLAARLTNAQTAGTIKPGIAMVLDGTMGSNANTGNNNAARYFYGSFLGCRLADSAPRLTRQFYEETCRFIDSLKLTPQKRLEARTHLVSYLKSEEPHLSVKDFAERFLPADLRDGFADRFR
ncbi:MAG: nucleoid-associated protein, partial [Planctomycetota bacterium]|nr:nucleoid-associated protein [Planctomycetota bacterium]